MVQLELDPADPTRQTVLNPAVLVEVQSPSTESDDRGPKLDGYKLIRSVRAVVLVSQDEPRVIIHARQADGGWASGEQTDGIVDVPAIGCRLPVEEIYEDLPPV